MTWLRDIAYAFVLLVTAPVWLWRLIATGKWQTDWAGRLGRAPRLPNPDGQPRVLIHAVSVGEVNAVRALVEQLADRDDLEVVVATTTNTGFDRATSVFGDRLTVLRYPLDFSGAVRRFLDRVRPTAVVQVELELWPNFVTWCRHRGIAVLVVNGRLSERSFRRYRLIAPLVRPVFAAVTAAAVQTDVYARRFEALGTPAQAITVAGSMKWDTAPDPGDVTGADALAEALGIDHDRPVIVAGSTGPGEETWLTERCPDGAQLILVPRKPERFDAVAADLPGIVRRSDHPDGQTGPGGDRFLLDTMGELLKAYQLADIAIVGRSFLGLHGSNPLEPIGLGRPTLIGPHHDDFKQMVAALADEDGILVTDDPGPVLADLLDDPDRRQALAERGRAVIEANRGATDRQAALILEHLPLTSDAARPTD
ncbi:MAG: glycosyltransferase N-terminal domain-containing protein [Phycisphaeraceae bacterium]|nr:glycosyltransferase N-terminal domain-containing protein [Phycisphaeraceae bacterium]